MLLYLHKNVRRTPMIKNDFSDISTEAILNAAFDMKSKDPVLRPFDSLVVADPSLLTPEGCHDGKWHMFFHTNLGVYHFISDDGVKFKKVKLLVLHAMRPNINYIDGRYYLFFEKTRSLIPSGLSLFNLAKWKSEIQVIESDDLIEWTKPKPVITYTKRFESAGKGYSISNPFLLRENGKSRMYFSCGLTFINDCGFSEPTYINYAESKGIAHGYVTSNSPIISPDRTDPYLNLCSGCLKVYRTADGYLGIQNGIYEKNGKSHSAILALTSEDGLKFRFAKVLVEPAMYGAEWMKQFVYASHLVRSGNELRLYFNGRDTSDMIRGRECIGFVSAEI